MRLAAQAKGGYYPTPDRVVDLIAELIHTPSGSYHRGRETLRILEPACGRAALQRLAENLDRPNSISIETYGVELHRDRAEEAEKRLHRTLAADLFATSIANGAFGLLLLNPPYDFDSRRQADGARLPDPDDALPGRERPAGLHRATAAPRGLGPVSLHPLRADALLGLPRPGARGLRPGGADGVQESRPRSRRHSREHGAGVGGGGAEPLRSQRNSYSYTEYSPATTPSGDVLFTTRTVDPVAAAAEARRSGLWTSTEITDTLWPANDNRTRPLMPLKRGHMAMLVAAGFLNNLVLEADDRRILVKGRTSKDMVLVEDAPEKEVTGRS